MHFNKIQRTVVSNTNCTCGENKSQIAENTNRIENVNGKEYFLLHSCKSHCVYVLPVARTFQASAASASHNFDVKLKLVTMQDIGLHNIKPEEYTLPEDKVAVVYGTFLDVNTILSQARTLVQPGATPIDFVMFCEMIRNSSCPLTKEVQFNDWLVDSIAAVLQPAGYIVDVNNKICEENLNEYWTPQPDCLLYKGDSLSKEYVSSLSIMIGDD